jgi:predicted nucleic acid-binding protein
VKLFFDTNVLIYARVDADDVKSAAARLWINRAMGDNIFAISAHVLGEYAHFLSKRATIGLPPDFWFEIERLFPYSEAVTDIIALVSAGHLRKTAGFQWWDSCQCNRMRRNLSDL